MYKDSEILKEGVFFYANSVPCDIRIFKHNMRYGTGDVLDEAEWRDDIKGEFYYIEYGSTKERGRFVSMSSALPSLEIAIKEAEKAIGGNIQWLK